MSGVRRNTARDIKCISSLTFECKDVGKRRQSSANVGKSGKCRICRTRSGKGRQSPANIGKRRQIQAKPSKFKQVQANSSKFKQIQANSSKVIAFAMFAMDLSHCDVCDGFIAFATDEVLLLFASVSKETAAAFADGLCFRKFDRPRRRRKPTITDLVMMADTSTRAAARHLQKY